MQGLRHAGFGLFAFLVLGPGGQGSSFILLVLKTSGGMDFHSYPYVEDSQD